MLTLINQVSGRPWAIRGEIAANVRGLVAKEGLAGLRHLADMRTILGTNAPAAARGDAKMATTSTVAVVPVIGTVLQRGGVDMAACVEFRSTTAVAEEIAAAAAEPKVDAVVVEFDSPGGEVFGVPEAWAAIRESAKTKPIIAAVNSVAASAAYWLATACTEIWVTPSGQVGSIGVYCLHVDISKALEDLGEKWTFVYAGDYKVEGNPAEPLGDEALAALQADVDRYYEMFEKNTSQGRGVTPKYAHTNFGKGRMLGAAAAVEAKMADKVGTLDQAIRRAAQLGAEYRKNGGPKAEAAPLAPVAEGDPTQDAPIQDRVTPTAEQLSAAARLRTL